MKPCRLLTFRRSRLEVCRGVLLFIFRQKIRTDDRVRTYVGALVALDACLRVPDRDAGRDAALLIGGQAHVHDAVLVAHELTYRQVVALLGVQRIQDLGDDGRDIPRSLRRILGGLPALRNLDFNRCGDARVDGLKVAVNHVLALGEVGLLCGRLHVADGLLGRNDRHEGEKCRLQNRIRVAPEA